jgi:hypothetical protein
LIEFEIDGVKYEQVFMVSPNLEPDSTLGINLFQDNDVAIDVTEKCFRTRKGEVSCAHRFFFKILAERQSRSLVCIKPERKEKN